MRYLVILLLLVTYACGGSGPSAPTPAPPAPPTTAVLSISAPQSWTATCVQTASLCTANVSITVSESAGVGATVTSIDTSFTAPGGQVVVTATYDAAKIILLSGTNKVPARGSLTIPSASSQERIGVLWTRSVIVDRTGTLTILVRMTDDNGHTFLGTVKVAVS